MTTSTEESLRRKELKARAFRLVARAQIAEQLVITTQDRRQDKTTVEWAYRELERLLKEEKAATDEHP